MCEDVDSLCVPGSCILGSFIPRFRGLVCAPDACNGKQQGTAAETGSKTNTRGRSSVAMAVAIAVAITVIRTAHLPHGEVA